MKTCFMVKNTHSMNGHMLLVCVCRGGGGGGSGPTTYLTEIKETYFETYIYQESCPFPWSQSANQYQNACHYMTNCLHLHDIIKFDFMNYAFAQLVLAWLYITSLRRH